jgi:hypothetical protein
MVGKPGNLFTKRDWLNAVNYAKATGDGKGELHSRLLDLKNNTTILVLKASAQSKPSEEQTPEDFEAAPNPNCEKHRLGFTDAEIDQLISEVR